MRIDARHVPVPVELSQHDLVRVQRPETADDLFPGRLQVQRVEAGRGFHGDLGGHLEQVRDEHVQHRTGGVVELGPVADAERLGHVDLHRLDVLAVPVRGEGSVGEAQHVQILGGLLAQEMVDPVHLLLVEDRMDDPVELAKSRGRGAKRFLVDDSGVVSQSMPPQRFVSGRRRLPAVRPGSAPAAGLSPSDALASLSTSGRLPGLSALNPPPAKNTRCANESHSLPSGLGPNSASAAWTCARKLSWAISPRPFPINTHCRGRSPSHASR